MILQSTKISIVVICVLLTFTNCDKKLNDGTSSTEKTVYNTSQLKSINVNNSSTILIPKHSVISAPIYRTNCNSDESYSDGKCRKIVNTFDEK